MINNSQNGTKHRVLFLETGTKFDSELLGSCQNGINAKLILPKELNRHGGLYSSYCNGGKRLNSTLKKQKVGEFLMVGMS